MLFILASSSPRRQQLLRQMGATFDVIPADIDELQFDHTPPAERVELLARTKAEVVAAEYPDAVVLGSDTMVVLGDEVLNKPADEAEARYMLRTLSGNTHCVYTGYALIHPDRSRSIIGYSTADVTFRTLSDEEIARYVATGLPLDKAGSYGIQDDYGAVFVEKVCGDFYAVIGLPVMRVYLALRELSVL